MGIPGRSLTTRHLSDDIILDRSSGASEGKTWDRNTNVAYVLQSSLLKNLGLRLRNTTRSNFGNDLNDNRFIVSYSLPLPLWTTKNSGNKKGD